MELGNSTVNKAVSNEKKEIKKRLKNVINNKDNLNQFLYDFNTSCKVENNRLSNETLVIFEKIFCPISDTHNDINSVPDLLNKGFGKTTTALHIASLSGHKLLIETLLEHGADPTIKDRRKKTPYDLAPSRLVKNIFRRYQAKYPDQHNWPKLPTTDLLTPENEARQEKRRKAKKQAKRDKKLKKPEAVKEKKAFCSCIIQLSVVFNDNLKKTSSLPHLSKCPLALKSDLPKKRKPITVNTNTNTDTGDLLSDFMPDYKILRKQTVRHKRRQKGWSLRNRQLYREKFERLLKGHPQIKEE